MAYQYKCSSCSLEFTLGTFHPMQDYGGGGDLVCLECGTQHTYEFPPEPLMKRFDKDSWTLKHVIEIPHVPKTKRLELMKLLKNWNDTDNRQTQQILNTPPITLLDIEDDAEQIEKEQALKTLGIEYKTKSAQAKLTQFMTLHATPGPVFGRALNEDNWITLNITHTTNETDGGFYIELQKCGGCGKIGSLRASLPNDYDICPHCKNQTLKQTGFFTN